MDNANNQGGSTLNQALLDEERQKQQQEQQQEQGMSGQPQLATRSRVSQAGQGTSPAVTAMPKQQQAGTGTFTNLRKYLEAARPASQERIAQAATQRVMGATGAAQKGIEQAKTAFGRNVEAGSLADRQQALEQAKGIIGGATGVTYQPPQPVTPPTTPTEDLEAPAERRLVPLSAEAEPSTQPITPPVAPAEPAPTQQYISPEDQARFAEIINAAYQGPMSLQQAGLYQSAAEKAREAQRVVGDVQTTTGRERILRDVFGRGRDYTQGQSRLDQLLLNTSEQGVRGLQETAQQAGNLEQAMQQAVRETAAQAAQRRSEIEGIRGQAREAFTTARTGQEEAVEKRIDDLITNPALDENKKPIPKLDARGRPVLDAEGKPVYMTEWERLPAYFKNILNQSKSGAVRLSPDEMAVLGVRSGEGLYNVSPSLIQNVGAERERLVTKDELAKQFALQQLAQLDVNKELQKDLRYTDLEKAGTQDLLSSLDVSGVRERLEAEQKRFAEAAKKANLTGKGQKKVSRGNWQGKKTKTYYAEAKANVEKLLKSAGADPKVIDSKEVQSILSNRDLLDKYLQSDTETDSIDNRSLTEKILGESSKTIDQPSMYQGLAEEIGRTLGIEEFGKLSEGFQDIRNIGGGALKDIGGRVGGNIFGDTLKGIGGIIGGIDEGAMKRIGTAKAKRQAQEDLKKQFESFLKKQGFENRILASADPKILQRTAGLQELLRRKG